MIIDFHTHTFPAAVSKRIVDSLSETGHVNYYTDGSANGLLVSMKEAGVTYSVNLPVMTRADQVIHVNDGLLRDQEVLESSGIITFGGMHPDLPEYRAELKRLKEHGIQGIKLHSAFHHVPVNDIRYKRLIAAASEEDMIVTIHAGTDISFLEENMASVPQILDLLDEVHPTKLVLAHMGGWQAWNQVEKDLAGADLWLDTSFAIGPLSIKEGHEEKMPYRENLTAEQFIRLARKHGIERVLFATDSPWSDQRKFVEFIEETSLTEEEKACIFGVNALKLLGREG